MSFFVFVDNSNVWIEGKIASAVAKGWAKNHVEAHRKKIKDSSWRIDFDKSLYKEASAGDTFVLVMGDKDFI